MPQVARARLLAASALIATGVATLAALGVGISSAAEPYTATGRLTTPSAVLSAADTEFFLTCPQLPSNQGVDAFVFELPAAVAVAGTKVTVSASNATYRLSAFVYKSDCSFVDPAPDEDAGTSFVRTLAAGDRYLSVFSNTVGTAYPLTLTLTATPGSVATASPSASASASPSSTATTPPGGGAVTRRTYDGTPNDPLFAQDGVDDLLFNGQWGMRRIHAPEAWQEARSTGAGIRVGVLDSGLDLGHPDFACAGKVDVPPLADPDPDGSAVPDDDVEGHGTHVAGIIGACADNGVGVVGVAPDSTIVPIQVLSASTVDTIGQLARSIDHAVAQGVHVINMSLGFGAHGSIGSAFYLADSTYDPITQAIRRAVDAGVVVVAAAGNDSVPVCGFPAIAEDVVCVGATDPNDVNSWYGNFPITPDNEDTVGIGLMAPGGRGVPDCGFSASEVLSTFARSVDAAAGDCDDLAGYASIQGTSMATPHVVGVAALVYDRIGGRRSAANRAKVEEALVETAVDLYGPGYDPASGYGRVDALAAVRYWPAAPLETASPSQSTSPSQSASPSVSVSPSPTIRSTRVAFTGSTPTSGDFTDAATLAATLTDDAGAPLAGRSLTFQLLGRDGFREVSATTDATGAATAQLVLDAPPGAYDVLVGFSGERDTLTASSDRRAFTVLAETTRTTLAVAGSGSKKTLTATVVDADSPGAGVVGIPVTFYEGTAAIGQATTNADGVAVLAPPSGSKGSSKTYRASWAGDRFYTGSSS